MVGTPEGGRKAAEKQDMAAKGSEGGKTLASDPQAKSAAAHKGADTLRSKNPEHFKEIGAKGGKESGGGGRASGSQGGRTEEENEE
jgi:general stress protein YciG